MQKRPRISVVILNWNGKKLLEQFLSPLIQNTPNWVQLVVGDNASSDDSIEYLSKNFNSVEVLTNTKNYGYAGGYNHILKRVDADYFVLLNSDVLVTPGWIEPLIEHMLTNPLVAACQPKVLSFRRRTHFEHAGAAGGYMDRFGYFFCRGRLFDELEKDDGQYDDARAVFWASGAAFFVDAKLFNQAGGFDATLFAHMEEIDLCWRFKRMGKQISYVPKSTVYHVGGGTLSALSPQKTFLNFRNNLVLLYKNLGLRSKVILLPFRFFLDLAAYIRFIFLGEWKHAWAINRAHFSFLIHLARWERAKKELDARIPCEAASLQAGLYRKSIVVDYFLLHKRKFSRLDPRSVS